VFFGRIFAGGDRASRGFIAGRGLRVAQAAEQRRRGRLSGKKRAFRYNLLRFACKFRFNRLRV
jgi:hypothetical protein